MQKTALIIFQKNPELGKVKTRLAAGIGDLKALEIYRNLIQITCEEAQETGFEVFVFYSSFIPDQVAFPRFQALLQKGKDLGERMENAFHEVFAMGYSKAIIIGTDCPELSTEILLEAESKLETNEVVIGPAEDGGYYLLGLKSLHPELFRSIAWSTGSVLKETLGRARAFRLKSELLVQLSDLDTEEDLIRLFGQGSEWKEKLGWDEKKLENHQK
ncbi:TIGR04282 family arsenosugar biosynthesis glycosyltransferase [Algoriphagus confluentis]|uniref:TIGR04282 family arsenosugar biosynthesis glycosyltransferase n=1 Tax=Algoriphagus confluentis TaxID=1697556 RepID=A0ABQ6PI62_9BACT|nr:TIGR04282 family arsenosugar biosynthesis glycosyltransferase [Algoriphagus confluentis]